MSEFNPSLGYLWHAGDKGCFSPNVGKVELTKEQAEEHNARMGELDLQAMKQGGRATLYLTKDAEGKWKVSNFTGTINFPALNVRKSRNNWGAERFDTWFSFDGSLWHGVNVGDNEILRARRTKQKA